MWIRKSAQKIQKNNNSQQEIIIFPAWYAVADAAKEDSHQALFSLQTVMSVQKWILNRSVHNKVNQVLEFHVHEILKNQS